MVLCFFKWFFGCFWSSLKLKNLAEKHVNPFVPLTWFVCFWNCSEGNTPVVSLFDRSQSSSCFLNPDFRMWHRTQLSQEVLGLMDVLCKSQIKHHLIIMIMWIIWLWLKIPQAPNEPKNLESLSKGHLPSRSQRLIDHGHTATSTKSSAVAHLGEFEFEDFRLHELQSFSRLCVLASSNQTAFTEKMKPFWLQMKNIWFSW